MMKEFESGDIPVPGYKLTTFLGKGSYGSVWKASGPGGVECALKFINLDNKGGLKEFRAIGRVKRLKHPNLVPINAIWLRDVHGNVMSDADPGESLTVSMSADKQLVLAMGLGEKSLLDLLAEARVRPAADALPGGIGLKRLLKYMKDAAAGIDYLNLKDEDAGGNGQQEIIHCDIKPGNLLRVGGGVQVCDYGVAKVLDRSPGQDARTTMAAGTAAYAAPELINNEPGPWTDQYCLAITYYELRTGQLPFPEHRAMHAHLFGNLDFGRVPEPEREVLRQATAYNPEKRFGNCAEFAEALFVASGMSLTPAHSGPVQWPAARSSGVPASEPFPPLPDRVSDLPLVAATPQRKLSDLLVAKSELVPDHELVRQIGQGGYGQVWEAKDKFEKPCALKLVRDLQGKGKQELEVLKKIGTLSHPNLLKVDDVWVLGPDLRPLKGAGTTGADGIRAQAVVIKSPLAETNLRKVLDDYQRVRNQTGISPRKLLRYLREAADAIDYLHQTADLVHRDIKPENLLLDRDGKVLVSDFGLAKLVDHDGMAAQSTSSGMTQDYAAPEILTAKTVTKQSDQYSLAVTYHVLRTGRLPFPAGLSMLELIKARASDKFDLTAIQGAEQKALRRALSANPADRYPSCRALADAIAEAFGEPAPVPPPPPPPPPAGDSSWRGDSPAPAVYAQPQPADTGQTISLMLDVGTDTEPGQESATDTPPPITPPPPPPVRREEPNKSGPRKPQWVRPKPKKGRKIAAVVGAVVLVGGLAAAGAVFVPRHLARAQVASKAAEVADLIKADKFAEADAGVEELRQFGTPEADQKAAELQGQLDGKIGEFVTAMRAGAVKHAEAFDWKAADDALAELAARLADKWADKAGEPRAAVARLRADTQKKVAELVQPLIDRNQLLTEAETARVTEALAKLPPGDSVGDPLGERVKKLFDPTPGILAQIKEALEKNQFDEADQLARSLRSKPLQDAKLKEIDIARRATAAEAAVADVVAALGKGDVAAAEAALAKVPATYKDREQLADRVKKLRADETARLIAAREAEAAKAKVEKVRQLVADINRWLEGKNRTAARTAYDKLVRLDPAAAEPFKSEFLPAAVIRQEWEKVRDVKPADRRAAIAKLAVDGTDPDVKAWAKQLVAAYNAVDQKKEEWKKGVLTATTNDLAKLTAADPPALTGELLAADHVADLRADLKAARVKWVEDIIPKLGAGTDWAKLGELCAALGDESPTVKACRLECWVEGKLPAPGPAALAGATDGYSAYVTALTTDKPRLDADPRLDQLVPTGDAWPKWLNPYRAGKVHELLYQAAIGGRGDKPAEGLGDKPYPAATAGRAADYLAAAIRTADRTGVQVPAGRLADARYEYLLAWWSSPNRKPGEEAKAAADALAGELGNLNKSPTAQARFWLIRAEVRPEAAVECYAKVLDIARRETPPLDAGALFERVVKNLLDQTWINGVSTPTTRVSLARVCYQAGQEVRRKVAGWDDLPDLGGKVEETAAKLFDTANGLDPKPDYALWRSISTVLRQNGRVDPVAATLASANGTNPAGQLLTGLLAKRQVADVRDRAEQVARLKDADKAFRSAIDLAGPIPDRRDELVEAYKQAADTAILMANYDTRAKAEERKSLLADAERWSDKLLNMENGWLRAWDTKGCVLEDQAWLFKDDPRRFALTGGYAAADKAFTTALKHKGNRAEALMHRGRNQIKWAEDLYEDGARQVPVDTGKLKAARADLEDALKQLAARPRPDLQAECHYWRAKAAVVEWLAARPADKADLFDTAAREFEAAAGFAARPGGDRTGYRYTALFEWAKLCNDDGITAYNARDTGRCGEMADRIERILARPEAAEAMSAAVTGYHKANALNLRYFAAGKAGNFDAWLEDLDRLVTPAVDAPCPSQDVWLKVDLLVRRANALVQRANDLVQRANAGGLDPNRDISRAVEDGRRAVKEADDSAWVPPVSKVQALTALGRALDAAADRAEEKDSKRTRWTEAGDTYERAINLDPDPKVSWPVYLRLGRVRMKAADELDEKDVSGRASGYMLAVAALTEADAGERLPGAVRAIIKEDQKFLEEFRQKGKDDFVGKDGKGGMRSYLSSALANYPDDPSVDGWRLAQTEIDIWLNGAEKLSPDARETARQLTAKITAAGSGKQATPTALALGRLAVRVRKAVEP